MRSNYKEQYSRFNEPAWNFLAKYPLRELLVDMDLRNKCEDGLLYRTVRDLGIRPELLDIIERKLIWFATEAPARLNQRRFESPTYIRIFCQNRTVEDIKIVNSASRDKAERNIESAQIIHHSDPELNGGWGYFLVERGGSIPPDSSVSNCNWIELYLYKEGT